MAFFLSAAQTERMTRSDGKLTVNKWILFSRLRQLSFGELDIEFLGGVV